MVWHKVTRRVNEGFACGLLAFSLAWLVAAQTAVAQDTPEGRFRDILVVVGAPGEAEYAAVFSDAAKRWQEVFRDSKTGVTFVDGAEKTNSESPTDREQILAWVRERKSAPERWMVMIGHGTSDRDATKFNLRGPDLAASELSKAMEGKDCRWVIVNAFSSSGPFINALSAKNRIVVTATKSGAEENYSRFAEYLSKAISDPAADLDHDKSVSILEAFLMASNQVVLFYDNEGRLATEQALLDDNGDTKGTPASFYRGTRPAKAPAEGLQLDGSLAAKVIVSGKRSTDTFTPEQRVKFESLEQEIDVLRSNKKEIQEEDYYHRLELLLLDIAKLRFEPS